MTAAWSALLLLVSTGLVLGQNLKTESGGSNKTDQVGWLEPLTSGTELVAQETGENSSRFAFQNPT